ncbi:MAG: hypothetical protein J2P57_01470 [Acidimicrobiaceae bacterium]|nr:hypothetical protein [Acidimicrobiaceae bacterium]
MLLLGVVAIVAGVLAGCSATRGAGIRVSAPSLRHAGPLPRLVSVSNADNLPNDCIPQGQGPPVVPYELGFVGTVTGGTLVAGPAKVSGITAKVCGIVTVEPGNSACPVTGVITSNPDDQKFDAVEAGLTLVPGIQPKVPFTILPGKISGTFACPTTSQHGLPVTLRALVGGTTGLFGLQCEVGPLPVTLSGLVTGPLTDVTGTFTSRPFAVPAIGPSQGCSQQVASNFNAIAGLPIAPGGASISLQLTGSLYQPS